MSPASPSRIVARRIRSAAAHDRPCLITRDEVAALDIDVRHWRPCLPPNAWLRVQRAARADRGVRLSPFEVEFVARRLPDLSQA